MRMKNTSARYVLLGVTDVIAHISQELNFVPKLQRIRR